MINKITENDLKQYVAEKFGYADWLQLEMVDFDSEEDYEQMKYNFENYLLELKMFVKAMRDKFKK